MLKIQQKSVALSKWGPPVDILPPITSVIFTSDVSVQRPPDRQRESPSLPALRVYPLLNGSSVPLTTCSLVHIRYVTSVPTLSLEEKTHGPGLAALGRDNVLHFSIRESYTQKSVARWPVHVKHSTPRLKHPASEQSLLTKGMSLPAPHLRAFSDR
jgi:hypothetical protein